MTAVSGHCWSSTFFLFCIWKVTHSYMLHPFNCTKMWHAVVNNSFSGYCHNVASFVYIPAHVASLPSFSQICPFPDPSPLILSSQWSPSPGRPFPCTYTSFPHQPIIYTCTTSIGLQVDLLNVCHQRTCLALPLWICFPVRTSFLVSTLACLTILWVHTVYTLYRP